MAALQRYQILTTESVFISGAVAAHTQACTGIPLQYENKPNEGV